jgi:hypothetical protein
MDSETWEAVPIDIYVDRPPVGATYQEVLDEHVRFILDDVINDPVGSAARVTISPGITRYLG